MQAEDTYNRGGFLAFIFSMAFSLSFFVYISFIHPGVDLKEVPESEMNAEQTMADGSAPAAPKKVDVSSVTDPWNSSEDMIAHGAAVYKTNCAICHGDKGEGNGPAGMGLVPKPRNLVAGEWKKGSGTRKDLYETVRVGLDGTSMAAFGHLPKVDRWALVHWIRSITENKKDLSDDEVAKFAESAE